MNSPDWKPRVRRVRCCTVTSQIVFSKILEFVSVWMTFIRNKHHTRNPKLKQLIRNYMRLVHVAK